MTQTSADIYYDPYDLEIDVDPYPLWKRMRDEAPLYYNDRYDFYAVTRFDDVEKSLADWKTYISGKGSVLEMIKANIDVPPGSILFEDPPAHDIHRGLLSRVFTPKRMNAIEPKVREFCAALPRSAGWGGRVRFHPRSRCPDADADDRDAARDSRGGSGAHPRSARRRDAP